MADMTPTENFISTLSQTPTLAGELSANFTRLKNTNDEVIKYLGYPQTVADDLNKLYSALETTNDLLDVVTIIPEVGEAAAGFKDSVSVLMHEIEPAKDAANKLADTVKPIETDLKKLDPILDKGISAANDIQKASSEFLNQFKTVSGCIDGLPDGSAKTTAQNYLNQFSEKVEPEVSDLNTAMSDTNSVINSFYNTLNDIKNALNPLPTIIDGIEDVTKVLDPVMSVLSDLKHELKSIKIPIPIPYPQMVSLYDIFKDFGKFVDLAMKPIESLVDDALKALDVSLPSIPDLNDLLNINISMPDIPDFDSLINTFQNAYNEVEKYINMFNLNCPPADDQTDFNTQLNG